MRDISADGKKTLPILNDMSDVKNKTHSFNGNQVNGDLNSYPLNEASENSGKIHKFDQTLGHKFEEYSDH